MLLVTTLVMIDSTVSCLPHATKQHVIGNNTNIIIMHTLSSLMWQFIFQLIHHSSCGYFCYCRVLFAPNQHMRVKKPFKLCALLFAQVTWLRNITTCKANSNRMLENSIIVRNIIIAISIIYNH